jgi:hypothetical protein
MNTASKLAEDVSAKDPAVGLRAAAALRRVLERMEQVQVANARERGWSWQKIAEALDVSPRAVHKMHRGS